MTQEQSPTLVVRPEERRIASQQYERARQLINSGARNLDYAISLLMECCRLDPGNLPYRQLLRRTEIARLGEKRPWAWLAWLRTMRARAKMQLALQQQRYRDVLHWGERILLRNPWDIGAHIAMAQAAEKLGLNPLAEWLLRKACEAGPKHAEAHRQYGRFLERMGDFQKAAQVWTVVARLCPTDQEANRKQKDLAAMDTIARGGYERPTGSPEQPAETPAANQAMQDTPLERSAASALDPDHRRIELLRAHIQSESPQVSHFLSLADIYRRRGQLEEAARTLQEGIQKLGPQFDLQQALAELEIETLRNNLRVANRKVEQNPQDELARQLREKLATELLRRELDYFRARLDRYPHDNETRLQLATRLMMLGLLDEAIQEFQSARKDPKTAWRALLGLGRCFRKKRNPALAVRNFQEALKQLPAGEEETRKELLFELATLAAEDRDFDTAIRLGTELADLDYFYRDIGKLLEQWQSQRHPGS
jgi:tetratricopeptide (TPR) repeat protein